MDDYITRQEHEEFARRLEDEDHRQNHRLELLEANVLEMGQLTTTVAKLAVNMESMLKTQAKQEKRLEDRESKDGEMWRKVTGHVITVVIGIVVGYIFTRLGM